MNFLQRIQRGSCADALRVSLGYLLLAEAWILLSGGLLSRFAMTTAEAVWLESAKGTLFVLVTTLLLFLLLKHQFHRRAMAAESLAKREQELRLLNENLERQVTARTIHLESARREQEAFSHAISHELGGPVRAIAGFSQTLLEDYAPAMDGTGRDCLQRIRLAGARMARLIEALRRLSHIGASPLALMPVDLSRLAAQIMEEFRTAEPARRVDLHVAPDLFAVADRDLLAILLDNLLGNAWKYSARRDPARIEFGCNHQHGERVFHVRDNGTGFVLPTEDTLFAPFQRFHAAEDFPGTGMGLATVKRIIERHGGSIRAESSPGEGAAFFFTLAAGQAPQG